MQKNMNRDKVCLIFFMISLILMSFSTKILYFAELKEGLYGEHMRNLKCGSII